MNIKEINYNDYIPNEVKLSETNKLLICQNFGFVYEFVDIITPVGHGSVNIIFDIFYRNVYEKPEALIPREEYQDIFLEFEKWYWSTHSAKENIPFTVFKKKDFIFVDETNREPIKINVPEGTLIIKQNYRNQTDSVFDNLKAFWNWERYLKDTEIFCGYSKNKMIFNKG